MKTGSRIAIARRLMGRESLPALCAVALAGLLFLRMGNCGRATKPPRIASPRQLTRPAGGPHVPSAASLPQLASAVYLDYGAAEAPSQQIRLCQNLCETGYCPEPRIIQGVDACDGGPCGEAQWDAWRPIPWQIFAHGEYIGPHRDAHVPEYRLRVDDRLEFIYRLTRVQSAKPYELQVGDRIQVESLVDDALNRELVIQPDGTITLRLLGQVMAARRTVPELKDDLQKRYAKFYKIPDITVTPIQINTKLEDLRAAVDRRSGFGGQSVEVRITPEGTVQLTAIGSVPAQGMTLSELKREVDERYAEVVDGIEVMPVLIEHAPRYAYVVGEVTTPGRFVLTAPTTVMQGIALAGGWSVGANLRQIVIFRRAEDWRLMATMIDLRGALYGKRPCPADEIWLRDSDIVVVPKSPVLVLDDFIELVFTRGIYGAVPFGTSVGFSINDIGRD